ncbi:hypothetical protein BaRGS_00000170 [Batillaria attramentaria]|uniref:Serine protease HTRA2, mitochondrial n=1 Tax=Batillaria attramentaria TaxID=370345 RepID=A0ABD0M9V5_9CAEN
MACLAIVRVCTGRLIINTLSGASNVCLKTQESAGCSRMKSVFLSSRAYLHSSPSSPTGGRFSGGARIRHFTALGVVGSACALCAGVAYYYKHQWNFSRPVSTVSAAAIELTGLRKDFNFVADVVEKAAPAVVYIELKERSLFNRRLSATSNGSGFIVRQDGLILTNAHVVANKSTVNIRLYDGREMEGFVLAVDPVSDLCAIRINAKNLSVVKMGNSTTLRAGEWVVAMGSPLALSNTVTCGIVSSVQRRSKELGLHNKDMDYIQTDAVINFGNSGGPLVNLDGEVIGINTMKVTPGISFAIPIDYAKTFLSKVDELIQKGDPKTRAWFGLGKMSDRRRYMGITMLTLSPDLLVELRSRVHDFPDITGGVLVHKLIVGSPAYNAGIQAGDIIVEINGKSTTTSADVYQAVESAELLHVTVLRGNQKRVFDVTTEVIS